jgi:DNA-binding response OmpR family regulator
MDVLIVESDAALAALWKSHLERLNMRVRVAHGGSDAVRSIATEHSDVIILDLFLTQGSAMAVADYAQFKLPDVSVIFVTDTTFFSDGSIFAHVPAARAFLPSATRPEDLAAVVEHCGRAA